MTVVASGAARKQIQAGKADSVYLLVGEDDVEKSAFAAEFAEGVEEGLRAFNVERIHGGDMTSGDKLAAGVDQIISAARTLPMMAPHRVVTVTQAEMLLAPKREGETAVRALDRLEAFIREPEPHAVVVFVAGDLDKRGRMYKLLTKQATVVECGTLADSGDAERWVRNRVAGAGVEIDPAAARSLAQRAGTDIRRLRGEVERLLLYALGQKRITVDDAREIAGPAALQDDWAMTNAIEAGHGAEALRQLALLLDAGAPPEKVLGQLGWLVRSKFPAIAPDRVPSAIQRVFETDVALKRSVGDPRMLLERLVVELCGRKPGLGTRAQPR